MSENGEAEREKQRENELQGQAGCLGCTVFAVTFFVAISGLGYLIGWYIGDTEDERLFFGDLGTGLIFVCLVISMLSSVESYRTYLRWRRP